MNASVEGVRERGHVESELARSGVELGPGEAGSALSGEQQVARANRRFSRG
jgi:hypothetical protein